MITQFYLICLLYWICGRLVVSHSFLWTVLIPSKIFFRTPIWWIPIWNIGKTLDDVYNIQLATSATTFKNTVQSCLMWSSKETQNEVIEDSLLFLWLRFNTTFNNISVIYIASVSFTSWGSLERTTDLRQVTDKSFHVQCESNATIFVLNKVRHQLTPHRW